MDGSDFVSCQVPVVGTLQNEADLILIVSFDAKFKCHVLPEQLFVRDLVVTTIVDNIVEDLEEVDLAVSNLGLGVKLSASFLVEFPELVDEGLILGGAINGVLRDRLLGRHAG